MEPHPLDIPECLKISAEERAKAWEGHVFTCVPAFAAVKTETADTIAFRAQAEADRKVKTDNRIAKLKAKQAAKAAPVDMSNMRWDSRRNKFVPDYVPNATKS